MSYFPTDIPFMSEEELKANGIKVNCSEKPNSLKLKPCPFCGQVPHMYGMRRRDYVDGKWAQAEGEEYWVKPFCLPWCYLGEVSARAFRITEGIHYKTPEAAAKAWNRRAANERTD